MVKTLSSTPDCFSGKRKIIDIVPQPPSITLIIRIRITGAILQKPTGVNYANGVNNVLRRRGDFLHLLLDTQFPLQGLQSEKIGCIVPWLFWTLGAMFLRRHLLYFRSDKPVLPLYPFIAAGIILVGYIVYLFLSGDEEIHKIVDKIKTRFKKQRLH